MSLVESARHAIIGALERYRVAIIPEWRVGNYPLVQHMRAVFAERRIGSVIDVGANIGDFGWMVRSDVRFDGPIASFEPVSSVFSQLRARAAKQHNWSAFNVALGSSSYATKINVTAASQFASLLPPKEKNLFPDWNKVERQETVSVERLDDFVARHRIAVERAYLKIDTQGFDLEVLRGASGIMGRIEAIQIELSMRAIYEGAPKYLEVLAELGKIGFVVSGMFPISLTDMMAIEMDCVRVREHVDDASRACTYASILKRGILLPRKPKNWH